VTNIDDLLILSIYFAMPRVNVLRVVVGQYAGILSLIIISLVGLIAGALLDPSYIAWLGLLPLFIGLKGLYENSKNRKQGESGAEDQPMPVSVLGVAAVTIANGGDNIGVYAPLFARAGLQMTFIYVIVFLIMTAVWCALGLYFVRHKLVRSVFERYGKLILPYFLVLLGVWILLG
jgi:cadmium resistance protein CadD (predicted permease)